MVLHKAKVADTIRCFQRDDAFISELNEQVHTIGKLIFNKHYNKYYNHVDKVTNALYYITTSASNLQTIGEEYAGIVRVFGDENKLPAQWLEVVWIALYTGGESLFDRFLKCLHKKLSASTTLRTEAKQHLLNIISFLQLNKAVLIRLHQSLFYVFGKYYNVSHRLTQIKYIKLQDWSQEDLTTFTFKILGKLTLLYLLIYLLRNSNLLRKDDVLNKESAELSSSVSVKKICILCGENRTNTSSTPCGHLFCWACIHKSVKYSPHCPACREIVHPSRIVYLQNYF